MLIVGFMLRGWRTEWLTEGSLGGSAHIVCCRFRIYCYGKDTSGGGGPLVIEGVAGGLEPVRSPTRFSLGRKKEN